jgi:error-prone DNA polymerase
VPLFQEQAMKLAMVGAGYSVVDADRLRRDMAAFRRNGQIEENHRRKFIAGMIDNGYDPDFAESCLNRSKALANMVSPKAMRRPLRGWPMCPHG